MANLTLNITPCPSYTVCETNVQGATITTSGYSKISCGVLQLSSGVLGNYAIEWRLNAVDGEILFVSGNSDNTDNLISAVHPFVDEIVPGGTIYPVIKYVYVDGVRYDGYYDGGPNYSPDLRLCLTSTLVDSLNCDNGGVGTYSHSFTYNHINPNGSASRTFVFDIPNDGSEKYFAFYFYGDEVVDMLKVYSVLEGIVDTTTHLIGTAVGISQSGKGLITSGDNLYVAGENNYRERYSGYKYVINLTGVNCTYLKIEVTSSVDNVSNPATIWQLYLKCLSGWTSCDQYIVNTGWTTTDISNLTLSWDATNCRYVFTLNPTSPLSIDSMYNNYITNIPFGSYNSSSGNSNSLWIDFKNKGYPNWVNLNTTCYQLQDTVTYQKISAQQKLRISFTNVNDFNYYKSSYESTMANSNMISVTDDNTSLNYYKLIYFNQDFRDINCVEDGSTYRSLIFHAGSYVYFNNVSGNYYMDIYTHTNTSDPTNLHLPHYPLTNGLTPDACGDVYSTANGFVSVGNTLYNLADFTDTTKFINTSPFAGYYMTTGYTSGTTAYGHYGLDFSKIAVDEVCPSFKGSGYDSNCFDTTGNYYVDTAYRFYKFGVKCILTGADKTNGNSVNSYDVYRIINPTTGQIDLSGASDVLIKRVTP